MKEPNLTLQQLQTIDSLPISGTSLDVLDMERVRAHIASATKQLRFNGDPDPIAYLIRSRCMVKEGAELLATPTGILAFGHEPQRYFANTGVNIVHYRGSTPNSIEVMHIERSIGGTVFDQIASIEAYLKAHNRRGMTIEGGYERVEIYEYPPVVLRELSVNMIAHRDYRDLYTQAIVKVFDNHIEWNNPGGLPEGVTIDRLLDVQRSRNPALFALLFERGFIEGVGQGLDTVVATLAQAKMRPAEFEDINNAFFVARVWRRPIETLFQQDIYAQLNVRQKEMIEIMRQRGEVTLGTLKDMLGADISSRQILRDLHGLMEHGFIKVIGRSRNTRYCLQ
ncbi:ATP-binding protein [Candidatus Chloroploca asiatica]|uniref:Uncharacterized protein n=1 Tax=Candidatus Chloroploca asiatica TaxID=1506545 RepID=A0A2H3KGE5_9CHLR|nr:ATP-binding protein [Candidatus Chloroploca asiatica]PDV96815.1 hypothetical protein A9Q02_20265 [Candidatus Chloroploca asiatica]